MNIWRLQTRTDSKDGVKIADYCIDNKMLAMGWSMKNDHLPADSPDWEQMVAARNQIRSFEDYSNAVDKFQLYQGKVNANLKRLRYEVQPNDLVWLRSAGIYYLGRVTETGHWRYDGSQKALDLDGANQFTDVQWYRIGDESDVPGAIATSFIKGQTLQRIWKPGVPEYSRLLFNEKAGLAVYPEPKPEKTAKAFYSLLSTDDCEDLLCLWLYAQFGYIAVPSTNKKATECYECVLKDPRSGRNIYPQVKAGDKDLYKADYAHLDGEVWLFTTRGRVEGADGDYPNIHVADPQELYDFVGTAQAETILPASILFWYRKMQES